MVLVYTCFVLIFKPSTPRVKLWVIQSFLTFDSMDKTLKCDHSLESRTLLWCCLFLNFTQFVILEDLSVLAGIGTVRSETVKTAFKFCQKITKNQNHKNFRLMMHLNKAMNPSELVREACSVGFKVENLNSHGIYIILGFQWFDMKLVCMNFNLPCWLQRVGGKFESV